MVFMTFEGIHISAMQNSSLWNKLIKIGTKIDFDLCLFKNTVSVLDSENSSAWWISEYSRVSYEFFILGTLIGYWPNLATSGDHVATIQSLSETKFHKKRSTAIWKSDIFSTNFKKNLKFLK